MAKLLLQDKIEDLHNLADRLLHIDDKEGYLYVDNFSEINKEIHNKINDLYPRNGKTPEQEAYLCLAILMGYSVSMYANPDDEDKKRIILIRSQKIMDILPASQLKQQLSAVCCELLDLYEIN